MISNKDFKYLKSHHIQKETVEEQLNNFKYGLPEIKLTKIASIGNGIIQADEEYIQKCIEQFEYRKDMVSIVKMVPASGAASRMFKDLAEFRHNYRGTEEEFLKLFQNKECGSMHFFFRNLETLPFFNELKNSLQEKGYYLDKLLEKREYNFIIDEILYCDGLNYNKLPKGLLKFHSYKDGSRTPLEEHLVEAANYCKNSKNLSKIHVTVSEEHLKKFQYHIKHNRKKFEDKHEAKFNVSFSIQKNSTDTISVDENNKLIRDSNNHPLLRPGGHGALIENLNDIKADIIFIKNIDNVVHDKLKPITYKYKKFLAGMLLNIQNKVFEYLKVLDHTKSLHTDKLDEIIKFCKNELFIEHPNSLYYENRDKLISYLKEVINRPIRICGMVRNEGETGGGPFWVKDKLTGINSLQIVEKAQINLNKKEQRNIFECSTHFNPVDLVCGIRNYKGKKFNLLDYVDKSTGIISTKSYKGQNIKVQELPGLWNGAMAKWITIFVEVPLDTFSPVKTVHDLFKTEHKIF